MQKRLAELEHEARKLGLQTPEPTGRGGKHAKRDWVRALGDHYAAVKYPNGIPWGLSKRRELLSPMVAYLFSSMKEEDQREVMSSPRWAFERKVDGVRMDLFWSPEGEFSAFSRNISEVDYLPVDYTEKLAHRIPPLPAAFSGKSLIIDTEIQCLDRNVNTALRGKGVITDSVLQSTTALLALNLRDSLDLQAKHPLHFFVFDVMHYKVDVMEYPYLTRRHALERIASALPEHKSVFTVMPLVIEGKKEYLDKLLADGEEGVIAKNLDSIYTPTENRSRKHWVKIKRTMTQSLNAVGQGDTIDAYVVGFERGKKDGGWWDLVGSLDVAVSLIKEDGDEDEHIIARVSNLPMELRKQITTKDAEGNPALSPDWYGKVLEIDGQDVSARAKRFSHARIIRIREDKSQFECVMTEKFLNDHIL